MDEDVASIIRQALGRGGLHRRRHPGRAVQVDSIDPKLKPPGTKRLKVKCDVLLLTYAFKFNLRRYIQAMVGRCRSSVSKPTECASGFSS